MLELFEKNKGSVEFLASTKNNLVLRKAGLWIFFVFAMFYGWVEYKNNIPLLVIFFIFGLILTVLLIRKESKQFKPGAVLARVNWVGIESPFFNTKEKFFAWSIIKDVSILEAENEEFIQLVLKPVPGRIYKRSLLTWVNEAKPCLSLAAMDALDRKLLLGKIYDQINHHV